VAYNNTWYHDAVKKNGGWTLELINPNAGGSCSASANWTASNDTSGGTPGKINSVYSTQPDLTAPSITSVSVIDSVHVSVCFSEAITAGLTNTASYLADNGLGSPTAIVPDASGACAVLQFSVAIKNGVLYQLTVSGMSDCSGNTSASLNAQFSSYFAKAGDVIINEIFADPSPVVGLPAYEYVELRNLTAFPVDLANWQIIVNTSAKVLPSVTLEPDSFIILTSAAGAPSFSQVAVASLSSWPSLVNTGASIAIKNPSGALIDSVRYSDTWYQDAVKKQGGWSLELINSKAGNACGQSSNWIASVDPTGGTPGYINSVDNTDMTGPVTTVQVTDSVHITVCFSEAVDSASLSIPSNFSISNGIGTPVSAVFSAGCASLTLATPLVPGQNYNVNYTNIADCSGNAAIAVNFGYERPVAAFTYQANNLSVNFNDASLSSSGIVMWVWDFGNGFTSTGQNTSHNYLNSGTYNVCLTVTAGNGLKDSSCQVLNVTKLGIEDAEGSTFNIYPNPASDKILVEGTDITALVIYDLAGREITAMKANGRSPGIIPVGTMQPGSYILRIFKGNSSFTKHIHINR
jgi:hypothetical protein